MNLFLHATSLQVISLGKLSHLQGFDVVLDAQNGAINRGHSHERALWMRADSSHLEAVIAQALADPDKIRHVTLAVEDMIAFKRHVKKAFRITKAAGGLVFKDDALLFIHRNGYWDLPKGKRDSSAEPLRACAQREVEEECGVRVRTLERIARTYHLLLPKRQRIHLKRTDWYHMKLIDETGLSPQREEGIEKVEWVPPKGWQARTKEAYPSIGYVIKAWQAYALS